MLCSLSLLKKNGQKIILVGDNHDNFVESDIGKLLDRLQEQNFTDLFLEINPFDQNMTNSEINFDIINGKYASGFRKHFIDPRKSVQIYADLIKEMELIHVKPYNREKFPILSEIKNADDLVELIIPVWQNPIYTKTDQAYEDIIYEQVNNIPAVSDSLNSILKPHIRSLPEGNADTTNAKIYFDGVLEEWQKGKLKGAHNPKKYFIRDFIIANMTVLMDWYALLEICLFLNQGLNIIIFVGDVHSQIYKKFLIEELSYEEIYSVRDDECELLQPSDVSVERLFTFL